MRTASLIATLSFLSVACAGTEGAASVDLDDAATARTIADGTDAATIVLYLANSLDQDTLDDDATLDSRAAANIVAYRNGSDGIEGTSDDEVFDDLDELDAVSYVGDSAMGDLLTYGTDVIGLTGKDVHGVLVNSIEADAILFAADHLSQGNLDNLVSLDSRAAANIAADRGYDGFDSLDDLDASGYVGARAFGKLLDFADAEGMLDDEGLVVRNGEVYDTLQDAVDDTGGITIRLFAGTYTGSTDIGSTLIVRGYGKDRTVLDGQGTDQLLFIDGGSPCFYDMTIANGSASQGAAAEVSIATYVLFDGVDFIDNVSTDSGGAVYTSASAVLVAIADAEMSGNESGLFGGAVTGYGPLRISDSTLTNNHAYLAGAVYSYNSVEISDTVVSHNTEDLTDRGALTLRDLDIELSNIDFYDNEPNDLVLGWTTGHDGLGDDISVSCDGTTCTGL